MRTALPQASRVVMPTAASRRMIEVRLPTGKACVAGGAALQRLIAGLVMHHLGHAFRLGVDLVDIARVERDQAFEGLVFRSLRV